MTPFLYSSALCEDRARKKALQKHLERLDGACSPRIDNSSPREFPHLKSNRKKAMDAYQQAYGVAKANIMLRDKLIRIMNRPVLPGPHSVQYTPGMRVVPTVGPVIDCFLSPRPTAFGEAIDKPSMNYDVRKREAERITKENAAILARIVHQKPLLSSAKIEHDNRESEAYFNLISGARRLFEPGSVIHGTKPTTAEAPPMLAGRRSSARAWDRPSSVRASSSSPRRRTVPTGPAVEETVDVAPVAADDAWISPDAPTADAQFVPAPPKGSKPNQRRARKGTTVKARGSPRRSPRASVSPSVDGSPVRNKRLQSVQKSEARVGSALRDGALLFEGPIPMPAGGTGTLYIHWHALESCRLIVSLSTDDDWSGRKGIISERKLRAILAASTSLPHPLVKTAAADDVTWSRMIRSRAFSTDVAAAIAPLFRIRTREAGKMSLCLLGVEAGSDQTNDLFVSLNPSTDAAASNELASPVTVESPSRTNTVDVLTLDQSTAPALDLPAPKKDADSEYEDEFDDELVSPVSDGPLHSQSLPSGQPSTQKTSLEMVKGVADGIKQVIDVAVANTSEVLSRPRSGASGSSRDGNPTNPSSAIASTAAVEAVKPFHSAYIVLGGTPTTFIPAVVPTLPTVKPFTASVPPVTVVPSRNESPETTYSDGFYD